MAMAEREQGNAHKIEVKSANAFLIQASVGMLVGFISLLFLCYLIYYAISKSQTTVAIAIVGAMASIIAVFIYRGNNK